jgi:hypothetical protein
MQAARASWLTIFIYVSARRRRQAQFIADITSGDLKIKHIAREQLNVRVLAVLS